MDNTTQKVLNILKEEIVPAEGCTEPIVLAYVASKAKRLLGSIPDKIDVYVSGNMIKNVKSVFIPNGDGMVGIEAAVALGTIAGDCTKDLMVISNLEKEKINNAKEFLKQGNINVIHEKTDAKLYAKVVMYNGDDSVLVEIKHFHTNITRIEKNGQILIDQACNDADFNSTGEDRSILSIKMIQNLAKEIDINLIKDIFNNVIEYNCAIAKAGLAEEYGVNIGSLKIGRAHV